MLKIPVSDVAAITHIKVKLLPCFVNISSSSAVYYNRSIRELNVERARRFKMKVTD